MYSYPEGWIDVPDNFDYSIFGKEVEWSKGDVEKAAILVKTAPTVTSLVHAEVTVWAFGIGQSFLVADAPSLVHFVGQFARGIELINAE